MINFKKLAIPDVVLIEPKIYYDERGYFYESFNQNDFDDAVGQKITFVQDNHSKSSKAVLRGLHFQKIPYAQGKLVRVIDGEIWDVAVDIRKNSSTFGSWVAEVLSSENKKQLWIPEGFAHGFLVLSNSAEVIYKTTSFYEPSFESHISYDDPDLDIKWPKIDHNFVINEKDLIKQFLKDL